MWIKYLTTTDPSHSEFAGVWFVLLAFPWSLIFGMIIDRIDPYLLPRIGMAIDIFGVIINCVLIYYVFNRPLQQNGKKEKV
jgi:hypothetical protein